MSARDVINCLEKNPVIAAVTSDTLEQALNSPVEIIFHLKASLLDAEQLVKRVHGAGKKIFIHIDLMEGIGKDKTGIQYLSRLGADGIISTKAQLIKQGHEAGMVTLQRFFALDSKGVDSIDDMLASAKPDLIEIMPGIATKVIHRFFNLGLPVIAGGLIDTKQEITEAISNGAQAISTGKPELWYI